MEQLKSLREQLNLSQGQLAEKSGVSRVTISKLESGAQTVTTNTTILKLADALKVDPGSLIGSKV